MKTRLAIAGAMAFALIASVFVAIQPAQAAVGLRISNGRIVEANGTPFIMRGTSHPHVWFPTQTNAFRDIKALGANTVRVVLGSGQRWGPNTASDVANVVNLCKTNRLICVLEAHDTTGFGEEGAAATLDQAVSYWISVRSALVGQENFIVLNIGNEPFGNNESISATWPTATSNAINRLRQNGFEHLIMVDAPMWGQDWRFIARDNATTVFNSDPARNTVFSIHMYGVFDTAAEITDYLARFQTAGLPLVIGEFGHNHSDGNPDEDTIMAQAQTRGIGYIGWSWSGNGCCVEFLDMVTNFNPTQLTPWGQRIFNGANGIRSTAREATIYSGQTQPPPTSAPPTSAPPTSPPPTPGPTGACRVTYTMNTWNTGFTTEVTITNTGTAAVNGWALTFTLPSGQAVTNSWNASVSPASGAVTARNAAWNGTIAPNTSASMGFQATHTGNTTEPTAFSLNGAACTVA